MIKHKEQNKIFDICSKCNIKEIKKIIQENSSIINTIRDKNGLTPLHLYVRKFDIKIIELLLENASDPNLYSNYGYSALHYLILGFKENYYRHNIKDFNKILEMLIEKGANINQLDFNNKSPLYMIILLHNPKITKNFLKYKPEIDNESISIAKDIKNIKLKELIIHMYNIQLIDFLLMLSSKCTLLDDNNIMEDVIKFLI
jgi:ankyrin repeat protein